MAAFTSTSVGICPSSSLRNTCLLAAGHSWLKIAPCHEYSKGMRTYCSSAKQWRKRLTAERDCTGGNITNSEVQQKMLGVNIRDKNINMDRKMVEAKKRYKLRQRIRLECPACGSASFRGRNMLVHLSSCCPDLLVGVSEDLKLNLRALDNCYDHFDASITFDEKSDDQYLSNHCDIEKSIKKYFDRLQNVLKAMHLKERSLRKRSLKVKYGIESGDNIMRDDQYVAETLQISLARAALLVNRGKKDIPLVADAVPIEVIYEDETMIAVNKPPGIRFHPIHRFEGGSLVNRVIHHLHGVPPHVIHRLDMDTSGVAILAKDPHSAAFLHKQFRMKDVLKMYTALCFGNPGRDEWTVDAPIGKDTECKVAQMVTPDGKSARTHLKVVGRSCHKKDRFCTINAFPQSGRTHQIRVHLQHSGHTIVGDNLYGGEHGVMERQALHASLLEIVHPVTKNVLTLRAPIPDDMKIAIEKVGCSSTVSYL